MTTIVRQSPKPKAPEEPEKPEPPSNVEFERSILGGIIVDNSYLKRVAGIVKSYDFFLKPHRHIFGAMLGMATQIDDLTLVEELTRLGELEEAGGAGYVYGINDGVPRIQSIETYAHRVAELALLRQAMYVAQQIQERAALPCATIDSIRDSVEYLELLTDPPKKDSQILRLPDMPEAVLDSRLGEICIRRLPGFPTAYSWPALLAVAGAMVPQIAAVRSNLFCCLVGDVGSGKSHAINCAKNTLGLEPPVLQEVLAGSAEGLLETLSDANGSHRLLSPDELGHLLTKAKIDLASFPFVLNSAFYKTQFQVTAARGKQIAFNASLGLVGGIVEENFETHFGCATTGGLHDRFLFGLCPRPFTYDYRPHEGEPEITEPCPVTIARDVWEARDEWMRTIPGMTSRCAEIAIRAATVAAAFSGRLVLYAKDLAPARALAEYESRIRKLLKPNPGENSDARCANAILTALDKAAGWAGKREIGREIHAERFGPSVFERAIKSLQAMGEIVVNYGRPVTMRRVA